MSHKNNLTLKNNRDKELEKEFNSSKMFKSILGASPIGINLWTKDMLNIMCNAYILDTFNVESGEEFLDRFYEFSPEFQPNGISSKEMSIINFQRVLKEGKYVFNWMHTTPSGKELPSEITLIKIDDASSEDYVIGFIKDLRGEFAYNKHEIEYDYYFNDKLPKNVLMEKIEEMSDEWFYTIDLRTGNFHYYGKKWFKGFGHKTVINENQMLQIGFIHEDDIEQYKQMSQNIKNGVESTFEIRLLDNKKNYRYHKITGKLIKNSAGTPVFVIGKGIDIHEQHIFEELSQKDLLTDCYNKISAQNIISEKLQENIDSTHTFFIVDIDNFKAINDNLGHYFGDEVLRDISAGLKNAFRDVDIVARIGGDEFIIFVENLSDHELILQKAEKILEVYRKTYSGEYKDYSISGSVGIALYPRDGKTYEELYQNADKALSHAKIQGKNMYKVYTSDFNIGTTRNITKIENANRVASSFFDYDLISVVFNILYEKNGSSDAINLALSYLCQKYNADRSYIFETLDGGQTLNNTYEYCNEGINSEIDNLQGIPYELFADFLNKAHNDIIYSNNLRETLEQDRAFEIMDDQGILSFVHAQIKRDGEMTFFIGLDDCTKTRIWTEKEINSLQYIGKLISIILQGTHLREELNELAISNKNSADILELSDSIVYVSDLDTHEVLYLNKIGKETTGLLLDDEFAGEKCFNLFQGSNDPCDFCTNHLLSEDKYYEWSFYNERIGKTYLLKDKLIHYNGKLARLEIATDITKIVELEKTLSDRLDDEQFLMNCVEMLHSGNEPNKSLQSLLKAVTQYYDAERSYIFEVSKCGKYISNTYEYCKEGSIPYINKLQNLPIDDLRVLLSRCDTHEAFHLNINDVGENSLEYALMELQELNDITIGAIRIKGNEVTGFVGVDNAKKYKDKVSIIRTVAKFTATFLDETKLVEKLNHLSYFDTLTGVKNRYSYNLALNNINSNIENLGILYVDILGLSAINHANGIMYGDNIIITLANILDSIFTDKVFRVGGDEFVVIWENIPESDFEKHIALLKNKLAKEREFKTSIGYAWNKNFKQTNKPVNQDENYSRILRENLEMEIAGERYIVYMQPKVTLSSGEIHGAEALIRRLGTNGILQPPIYFLPFYEKEGIISKIDEFVFETVCKTLKSWKDSGIKPLPTISVNCSRTTIATKGIVERFLKICENYSVDPSGIIIETTETINSICENALSTMLKSFSDVGFVVSLDDFGSGYSNLNSLVISDFAEIKIDTKVIGNVHKNKKAKALTQTAISLCQSLDNIRSVAEGVEEKVQHELLCEMGCKTGQGFYYAKPMPIDEFTAKYLNK